MRKRDENYNESKNLKTKENRLQEKKETGKKRRKMIKRKRVKINPRDY